MSAQSEDYERGYYKGHGFPGDANADLNRADLSAAYKQGIRDALAGLPSKPPIPAPPAAPQTGTPPAAPASGSGGVYLPPPASGGTPAPLDPQFSYQMGYRRGKDFPDAARLELSESKFSDAYKAGIRDALAGVPDKTGEWRGPYKPRKAPAYGTVPRVQPLPMAGEATYYEVLATSPLGRLPYDYAVGIERKPNQGFLLTLVQSAISFQLLGADPADWRDGYRLSGPNGPIAKRVQRLISEGVLTGSHADPRFYGLDGWYGAQTRHGLRILGKAELRALGLI